MSPICPEISVACGHGGIPTGHVFRVERKRGPVWYAKYRLPDGRQVQKKVGPAWTERGRSANGYFTKRLAEEWLRSTLDEARRGTLPGLVRTGATFADAAAEWLRYVEDDRGRKPSTVAGYRSIVRSELLPHFGEMALESVTPPVIEAWQGSMTQAASTRSKALVLMHGIFQRARKVWSLATNPVADVEKPPLTRTGDLQVFSPEEVWALVRAAGSEQDATLFLAAAFTGLRMGELLALRWRDVDFTGSAVHVRASYYAGHLSTPKSGRVRAVPLAPDVARALAQLSRRKDWVGDDDLGRCRGSRRVGQPHMRGLGTPRPVFAAVRSLESSSAVPTEVGVGAQRSVADAVAREAGCTGRLFNRNGLSVGQVWLTAVLPRHWLLMLRWDGACLREGVARWHGCQRNRVRMGLGSSRSPSRTRPTRARPRPRPRQHRWACGAFA